MGRRTSAAEGAVRPQPERSLRTGTVRTAAGAGGVDGTGVDDRPHGSGDEQRGVGQDEVLRFGALALLQEERIPEDGDGERDDRQLEQACLVGGLLRRRERPEAVGEQGAGGEDGAQIGGELGGVRRQRGTDRLRSISEIGALTGAFARHHEECTEAGDDEEPFGDRQSGGGRTADGAEHETGCDRDDVEDGEPLQPQRVEGRVAEIGEDGEPEVASQQERTDDRGRQQHDRHDPRQWDRYDPGCDRAVPFRRVTPVRVDIERVVHQVGGARRGAEAHECDDRLREVVPAVEDPGRHRCGEDEDVLDPLLGSQCEEQPERQRGSGGGDDGHRAPVSPDSDVATAVVADDEGS